MNPMTTLSLKLPNSLHKQIEEMAKRHGITIDITIDQFLSTAPAEKLAALKAVGYLEQRAKRASQEEFRTVLAKAPDMEPEEHDRL